MVNNILEKKKKKRKKEFFTKTKTKDFDYFAKYFKWFENMFMCYNVYTQQNLNE